MVREAIIKAADLYQQSGNTARSVPHARAAGASDYPTPVADAIEVRQRLLDDGGQDRRYRACSAIGNTRSSKPTPPPVPRAPIAPSTWRPRRSWHLAEPTRDAFRNIKLVAPLKQTLVAKKKAMEAAMQAYKQVAEYQVAETTTAATFETAELYRTLAHDLLHFGAPEEAVGR